MTVIYPVDAPVQAGFFATRKMQHATRCS
jgi:hypothetical protein